MLHKDFCLLGDRVLLKEIRLEVDWIIPFTSYSLNTNPIPFHQQLPAIPSLSTYD